MNITSEQIVLIGFFALVIVQVLKLGVAYFGLKIDRTWLTVLLFGVAVALAGVWAAPSLPAFPAMDADPAVFGGAIIGWIGNVVSVASVIIGFATLIYNLLLQKVFEALGWTSDKVIEGKK